MFRSFPEMFESYLLGYFSGVELLAAAQSAVDAIEKLDFCEDVLPRFKCVCSDSKLFMDNLSYDIGIGQAFQGRCEYLSLTDFYDGREQPRNWFARKTVTGWHMVAAYDLGAFTGRQYYADKYALYLGTQAAKYDKCVTYLNDVKEQIIHSVLPPFAINPSLPYFAALFGDRLDGSLDAPIDGYLGGVSYMHFNEDGAREAGVRLKLHSVDEVSDRFFRLQPLENGLINDYDLYKDCCDLLQLMCLGDIPLS